MVRIAFLRHAEAEPEGFGVSDVERGLTVLGVLQAMEIGQVLKSISFSPDLVMVSDARRTIQTASSIIVRSVDASPEIVELSELRTMSRENHDEVMKIIEEVGRDKPFSEILRGDKKGILMDYAYSVAEKIRTLIQNSGADDVLIVGHHYTQNALGLAMATNDLCMGPFFNHAEGFMIENGFVTPIKKA